METILAIGLVCIVAWLLLSGTFTERIKDPSSLREDELELVYIELKRKILRTSAYDNELAYRQLYSRMKEVLGRVLERHRHYVLDVEAGEVELHRLFRRDVHHDSNGLSYNEYSVPHDLSLNEQRPEILLYLCFFLWQGGRAKDIGSISGDARQMLRILDHLILERAFAPAALFKGMVLKYGLQVYAKVDTTGARSLLMDAQAKGVGGATIELQSLDRFAELENVPSIHIE